VNSGFQRLKDIVQGQALVGRKRVVLPSALIRSEAESGFALNAGIGNQAGGVTYFYF